MLLIAMRNVSENSYSVIEKTEIWIATLVQEFHSAIATTVSTQTVRLHAVHLYLVDEWYLLR